MYVFHHSKFTFLKAVAVIGGARSQQFPFPDRLNKLVDDYIFNSHNVATAIEGSKVSLDCRNNVTSKVIQNFRQAKYRWIHNGMLFKVDKDRVLYERGHIIFLKARPSDSGNYMCQIEYEPFLVKTVAVFALLVFPENPPAKVVPYGRKFCLQCNSAAIGHLYFYMKRNWMINGTYYAFDQDIPAKAINEDCIDFATPRISGDWTCVTTQEYTQKKWSTAFYRIKVTAKPPIVGRMGLFISNNVIVVVILIMGIVLFFVTLFVAKLKGSQKTAIFGPPPETAPLVNSENKI